MPLISGSYPSLVNGVSQQPPSLRLPTQGVAQENMVSSLVDGLGKRNPTQHIARLMDFLDENSRPLVHFINRDSEEKYVMVVDSRTVRIFRLSDGASCPVRADTHFEKDYVQSAEPSQDLKVLTLADTTLLLNTKTTVQIEGDPTPSNKGEALVVIKAGNYLTSYSVTVNGQTSSIITAKEGSHEADTSTIARKLMEGLQDILGETDWNFYLHNSVFWISRKDGADFVISGHDSVGDTYLSVIKETVQRFSDLPSIAHNGMVIKVQGDVGTGMDDYWVKFTADQEDVVINHGIWSETIAPETSYRISNKTMPVQIVRTQDDEGNIYFKMSRIDWAPRIAGDNTGCPQPSFIGDTISAMFLHRNRLGFLSQSKIIMSASGDLFNFWRGSAQTTLDDDPIDVEVAHPRAVDLRYALPFGGDMLLFGDAVQFVMTSGDALTTRTVAVNLATEFESDLLCTPIVAGSSAYFPFSNDTFAGLREYYVSDSTGKHDATTVTVHVPQYIPGHITKLTASTVENTMIALSESEPTSAFVYNWFYNGTDKIQSSWSKWTFDSAVLGAEFIGSTLYLLFGRDVCGVYLEKIDLQKRIDTGEVYLTHLDRLVTQNDVTMVYDPVSNTTTITLPFYALDDSKVQIVTMGDTPGILVPIVEASQVGCVGVTPTQYRQAYGCDSGELEEIYIPAALGAISFKHDGECYFTTNDTEPTEDLGDTGRVAEDMQVFDDCHRCETGETIKYVQSRLCSTGALVDLWVPAVLAPLAFTYSGTSYYVLADQNQVDSPGTIAEAITPLDDCPDSANPPYQQVRRCDTGELVDIWVSTSVSDPFDIDGVCYNFQDGDPQRDYGGLEAGDVSAYTPPADLTCDNINCETVPTAPTTYATGTLGGGNSFDTTYSIYRDVVCQYLAGGTGGDPIWVVISCTNVDGTYYWEAQINPNSTDTVMTFRIALTDSGPPKSGEAWTYIGFTGTAPSATPTFSLS